MYLFRAVVLLIASTKVGFADPSRGIIGGLTDETSQYFPVNRNSDQNCDLLMFLTGSASGRLPGLDAGVNF